MKLANLHIAISFLDYYHARRLPSLVFFCKRYFAEFSTIDHGDPHCAPRLQPGPAAQPVSEQQAFASQVTGDNPLGVAFSTSGHDCPPS
jgi:hypothetical protein